MVYALWGTPPGPDMLRLVIWQGELGFQRMKAKIHLHMLRQASGYKLDNDGHDTRALQHYRPQEHPAHRRLYRNGRQSVQGFLAVIYVC